MEKRQFRKTPKEELIQTVECEMFNISESIKIIERKIKEIKERG